MGAVLSVRSFSQTLSTARVTGAVGSIADIERAHNKKPYTPRQNSSDKHRLLRDGIDTLQARDEERAAQVVAEHQRKNKSITFPDESVDYIEAHRAGWKTSDMLNSGRTHWLLMPPCHR
ncbi:hypothetical protein [Pseudomonas mucidolens]|uniref:hypothetical protein n=1 Tax=Pseudomonas mucidolens TaxID=46679 RepID=UPI001E3A88F8|nr:hypothetical protein [Pseudomonas mucidolens]